MNRSVWSIVAVLTFGWSALAGERFTISTSVGPVAPPTVSKRLGVGFLGAISFLLLDDVSIGLSSGYMTWGYKTTQKNNVRLVPIAFSARYYLGHSGVNPYACGEISYVIGEADWSTLWDRQTGEIRTGTKSISEFGSGLGLGVEMPILNHVKIDLGLMVHITSRANQVPHMRLMAGIGYSL